MIIVLGSVTIQQGSMDQALALSREHVARSRTEPGCLAHAVHIDAENPQRLVFVEQWSDHAALQQHFDLPDSRAFLAAMLPLASEAPSLNIYEASAMNVR